MSVSIRRITDDDVAIWDAWADAYQLIHRNLRAALDAVGVTDEGKPKSGQASSAVMSAFEGAKLRFFGHLLSGLKAPSLLAAIRADLSAGRSTVVQIVSTNEAAMERRLSEIPPEEWNNLAVDLTPKDTVLNYLMSAFPIMAMDAVEDEDGAVTMVPVTDEDGRPVVSQEALRLRDELVTDLACLPAVPGVLDAVLEALGTEQVAEITGRSRRVGAAPQRASFVALGCFTEIIAYTVRVFIPVDQPAVLEAVLAKWPPQSVLPKAA
jgi:hypothetical protein